jgi:uncharacterized protein YndB with AHSA1/START domain
MKSACRGIVLVLSVAAAGLAPRLSAAVLDAGDGGFRTRNEALIAAPPAAVWAALIEPARWWNPQHSWSGQSSNFSLEPRAGGCFCERLPDGGSVEHQRVVFVSPNRMLRLAGGLGPLQAEAVAAVLSWELKAEGDGTRLTQRYTVGGRVDGGLAGWSAPVDGVLAEQLERLRRRVETGVADAAAPPPGSD